MYLKDEDVYSGPRRAKLESQPTPCFHTSVTRRVQTDAQVHGSGLLTKCRHCPENCKASLFVVLLPRNVWLHMFHHDCTCDCNFLLKSMCSVMPVHCAWDGEGSRSQPSLVSGELWAGRAGMPWQEEPGRTSN